MACWKFVDLLKFDDLLNSLNHNHYKNLETHTHLLTASTVDAWSSLIKPSN